MRKKIISIGIITAVILIVVAFASQSNDSEVKQEEMPILVEADVIMPTKVSRPGCEETDSCYIPSKINAKKGQTVTWKNEDVAFHSVTSGIYGEPTTLFDSGHLDPEQKFSYTFDEEGSFDYFCTLHPWMAGKVTVQ
ncbi:MAG: cupredoxin domain-containing protein [Nitrosopumilus sp.]|nr:cupredoxin domain-containing protein [Nitrosopumilus sp.]MDH3825208.1 cupredoxin domain-containing protein [Nitrosopumilus sp.]